ncbi:serine/threonine-protein kinase [Paludisphaera mucosa]|uniref:Serine/threonine-protein kinase n=1 Tax=Paludisphaera mucosa TaxID=3030827 RepID=A0ABT6FB07_9BACT|nr:serine/threonine-protein kinase [Paludisphaera mucosa]MDG3004712.1 serine/threonine-protein kinase [Paludisphaera mucosa]
MTDESLFAAALEKASAPERRAFLDAAADDADQRRRVGVLVEAHERSLGILDRPTEAFGRAEPAAGAAAPGPAEGSVIAGRYKLIEEIGVGGMGSVWKAEQTEPVRRVVALKLVKPGMDSRTVLARFEAERQALALMEHPNIAAVLDGGVTENGRPFFVMEYVKGVPFTQYCDEARLSVDERLALFVPVCQAVQHAHTKGVIHRDIKPGNILVCLYDGAPTPKVIDFGLAKAMQDPLTEKTLHTAHGALLGTPLYMSPEQAEINNLDVDARSDVYALGVVLYEVLTGTTPLEGRRFREAAWHEMLRLIQEEVPPRPSARLSDSEALPSLAARRKTPPARLTRLMRGELDWIVMKCLEKDRARRYETASGLSRDLQRYLADESVEACPPSAGYRLRKFVSRNRGVVLAASIMFLLLAGGVVGTTWGMIRADRARAKQAEQAEGERKANEQAQKLLRQTEKGIEVLAAVFNDVNPREEQGDKPLRAVLADRLVEAADQIGGESLGEASSVAALQNRLAVSLVHLGRPQHAIPLFQKAMATREALLGPVHRDTLETMTLLAEAYRADGKPGAALPLMEEALKLSRIHLGEKEPFTLYRINNLAAFHQQAGRIPEAIALHEEALRLKGIAIRHDDPVVLTTMNNLADAYRLDSRMDKALPLMEETLRLRREKFGPEHIATVTSMNNLAEGYRAVGDVERALPLREETLRLIRAKVGPTHPNTLTTLNNMGLVYRAARQPEKARAVLEEALGLMKANLSPGHPLIYLGMTSLGLVQVDLGRPDLGLPLLEEALAGRKARLGPDDPAILQSRTAIASAHVAAGRPDQAIPILEEILQARKAKVGPDHPEVLVILDRLATAHEAAGQPARALPLREEAAAGFEKRGLKFQNAGDVIAGLADALERSGRPDDADAWRRKWRDAVKDRSGVESSSYAVELAAYGASLVRREKWAEAESVLRQALPVLEKAAPESPTRFQAQSLLGASLLGRGGFADAEPLLVQGYEGLKAREAGLVAKDRPLAAEAGDRIVRLYTAWGRPEKAAEWRGKLGAEPRP